MFRRLPRVGIGQASGDAEYAVDTASSGGGRQTVSSDIRNCPPPPGDTEN